MLIPVGLVFAVLVTLVAIKVTGGSTTPRVSVPTAGHQAATAAVGTTSLPAGVLTDVTSVRAETLSKIGRPDGLAAPSKISGNPAVLTAPDGKPEVLYIGAEYCPYCAAERWATVEALSRFGTFTGLSATHSSTSDIYPDTKTFSFYGSTYTSAYLDFVPVEEYTNQPSGSFYSVLQVPTKAEESTLTSLDVAPYTSQAGSIPFIDIGGHYLFIGATYNPQILAGKSMLQIASLLNTPSSEVADAIDGTANEMTAEICAVTGDHPAAACGTPTISSIMKSLGS